MIGTRVQIIGTPVQMIGTRVKAYSGTADGASTLRALAQLNLKLSDLTHLLDLVTMVKNGVHRKFEDTW